MALITTGKTFIRDLEAAGALGVFVPLEGGHEGRYQRRLRAAGYDVLHITAKGLGDVSAYLMDVHGVRPPHLGKKDTGRGAAVGYRYYLPPVAKYRVEQLTPKMKGVAIWLIEGNILARHELEYLSTLSEIEPRIKVVIEMGGDRSFTWKPLKTIVAAA
ncbi:NAD(P)H-quinone oxidoreductase subunit N [Oculatella sp. LEGE 06141]|uniref:NAD(P)H-quinone oxidoreductase subunit N n=1 Tax=Oculatella sp. LEGE 06141 TaxID=1828648 RepID=UPI001880C235|nr:NAD(P)H-quinone oxidoreductase subunit N [Oculatella sp. LEGE 06141]MBE9177497.1 NAD(P)H-quinone oxidoreductase subunit N [Oculatella sp. LEGE 06141]